MLLIDNRRSKSLFLSSLMLHNNKATSYFHAYIQYLLSLSQLLVQKATIPWILLAFNILFSLPLLATFHVHYIKCLILINLPCYFLVNVL